MTASAATPPNKQCPRCGEAFRCGLQGSGPCPCTGVLLDAPTLAVLRQRYADCLCLRCLQAQVQQGIHAAGSPVIVGTPR